MEQTARDTLCTLIRRYGHDLSEDPARCQGMLNDLLRGEHRREVFVLVNALKLGIAAELLQSSGGLPAPLLLGRLRQRLENDLAMTGAAAHWAVETWALALGVIDAPMPVQPVSAPSLRPTTPTPPATGAAGSGTSSPARLPFEPEMVIIPAGRFLMGSPAGEAKREEYEGPQHQVAISRPFGIGRHAVTFDDYDAFCSATGRDKPGDSGWGRAHRPVINVTWGDAAAYCQWLSQQTGRAYRLPTEAEWEYACRAGTTTPFHFGETLSTDQANCDGNRPYSNGPKSAYRKQTVPVGSLPANPWGLCEMHGNVWEWCQDWYGLYATGPIPNPIGPPTGERRVLRGGSWFNEARFLRSASRLALAPGDRLRLIGFRLALGPER